MDKIKRHAEICEMLNEVYKRKNHDYGDSFGKTYRKLGIISAITRITDKINRLTSLCVTNDRCLVSNETLRDTLLDAANYCIMTVIELDDSKKYNNID